MARERRRVRDIEDEKELREILKDIDLLLRHIVFRLHDQDPRVSENLKKSRRVEGQEILDEDQTE